MIDAIWHILLKLSPWLLIGTAVAALLHVLLPAGFAKRRLTGRAGVLRAVLFGVPLPLCSCGVVPTGIGLKQEGASDGAAIGFLISTPQTGVDSILVSASFLGWPFALLKVAAAAVTGILGGISVDQLEGDDQQLVVLGTNPTEGSGCCQQSSKLRQAVSYGIDLIHSIWGWLAVGVLISAAITVFLPPERMTWTSDAGVFTSSLMVLVLSVPLYVCATASVPIAGALVASGFPPGAALVFLMAGPATNVATIGAVYRHFGARVSAIYLGTIIVGSLIFAVAFNAVIAPTATAAACHTGAHGAWWEVVSSCLLLGLLAYFAIVDATARFKNSPAAEERTPEDCKSCS